MAGVSRDLENNFYVIHAVLRVNAEDIVSQRADGLDATGRYGFQFWLATLYFDPKKVILMANDRHVPGKTHICLDLVEPYGVISTIYTLKGIIGLPTPVVLGNNLIYLANDKILRIRAAVIGQISTIVTYHLCHDSFLLLY